MTDLLARAVEGRGAVEAGPVGDAESSAASASPSSESVADLARKIAAGGPFQDEDAVRLAHAYLEATT